MTKPSPRKTYGSFATGPLDRRLLLSMRVASDRITELEQEKQELIRDRDTIEDQLICEQLTNPRREFYWKWVALGLVVFTFLLSGCTTPRYQRPNENPLWVELHIRWITQEMREATKDIVFQPTK